MGFSNSPLATVRMISPNRTANRNHVIDTITIHCFVGQVTADGVGVRGVAGNLDGHGLVVIGLAGDAIDADGGLYSVHGLVTTGTPGQQRNRQRH